MGRQVCDGAAAVVAAVEAGAPAAAVLAADVLAAAVMAVAATVWFDGDATGADGASLPIT